MPELPEVETVVRALQARIAGRTLGALTVWQKSVIEDSPSTFRRVTNGATVHRVRRRGKWIRIELNSDQTILAHLRMTGRFLVVPADTPRERHDHLQWLLDDGTLCVRYHDVRRFGRFRMVPTAEVEGYLTGRGFGPEPLDVDPETFHRRLGRGRRSIKAALLDQRVVAGLGNIYADEVLFAARIDPRTATQAIGPRRAHRIHASMVDILGRAVAARGTTLRNYLSVDRRPGRYRDQLQVFHRTGEPCPVCGRPVARIRLVGRSTHFCRQCQR